jgi:hypothetical protein
MKIDLLEPTAEGDRYYNYCWWPYEPVAATEGKLRPVSLLFHSFELAGMNPRAFAIVQALRRELGDFRTVWGTKWIDGRMAWEFYFYDYARHDREVSMTRVLQALRPLVPSRVPVNEALPYFMFSLDITPDLTAGERGIDEVHMYIGNPGSSVSSGIAYSVRSQGTTLENFYFFFDARRQLEAATGKICCSAHLDARKVEADQILWPELRDCKTLCVANKRLCDTIYFSGVTTPQLLYFMQRLHYPAETIHIVEQHRGRLDHLLWDVGYDYTAAGGEVRVLKSGYYGVF